MAFVFIEGPFRGWRQERRPLEKLDLIHHVDDWTRHGGTKHMKDPGLNLKVVERKFQRSADQRSSAAG